MKTIYLIMMLLFTVQTLAGPGDEKHNPLDLTAEQKQQMQDVKQATHERLMAARKEIMADSKAQMAEFLTAEQMEQIETRQSHRKEHRQLRKNHRKMKKNRFKER